ncbi:MAG TPA: cyanophycin synthetase [Patescibacteria group bacterium]|nr:cyanophycin synthetase [Patescibacteria group bacterium]
MIDLEKTQTIYFIGIGGIAMSATAAIAHARGFQVMGSDSKEFYDPAKKVVEDLKVPVYLGYSEENIKNHPADLYVVSAGEDLKNPEVKYLEENEIPYISFPEFLYEISHKEIRLVVTGTHGKSTTSALLGYVLSKIDNSSYMVGGVLRNTGRNFYCAERSESPMQHRGKRSPSSGRAPTTDSIAGHYFVFEGDEYKALWHDPTPKLHQYKADALLLTNLEFDHPDVYKNLEEVKDEMRLAISNLPDDGVLVFNADSPACVELAYHDNRPAFGFGFSDDAVFRLLKAEQMPDGVVLTVENKLNRETPKFEMYTTSLTGEMNALNACGAIAMLRVLGFSPEVINHYTADFTGLKRRFEVVKEDGLIVIDDYAHHPTAVKETLKAARARFPNHKIWAVFEPHTYSRTEATVKDLITSFEDADEVLFSEIYPARERYHEGMITTEDILKRFTHQKIRKVANKIEAKTILHAEAMPGDVIVIMAVGNFNQLAYEI